MEKSRYLAIAGFGVSIITIVVGLLISGNPSGLGSAIGGAFVLGGVVGLFATIGVNFGASGGGE